MDREHRDKWVAALRSGKYEQGKEALQHNGTYCCLGVYANEFDLWDSDSGRSAVGGDFAYLLGNRDNDVQLQWEYQETLAAMNDDGKSFDEIADWIETYL